MCVTAKDVGANVISGAAVAVTVTGTVALTRLELLDMAVTVTVPGATPVTLQPRVAAAMALFDVEQVNAPTGREMLPTLVRTDAGVICCWAPIARLIEAGDIVAFTAGPAFDASVSRLPSGKVVEYEASGYPMKRTSAPSATPTPASIL